VNGRLLLQLSFVALNDQRAVHDPYAWPPLPAMTAEQKNEVERLGVVSARLAYRAACLGWTGGTDMAFGEELVE
jgi:hypothetical protein